VHLQRATLRVAAAASSWRHGLQMQGVSLPEPSQYHVCDLRFWPELLIANASGAGHLCADIPPVTSSDALDHLSTSDPALCEQLRSRLHIGDAPAAESEAGKPQPA
jgi:hypothetical protein